LAVVPIFTSGLEAFDRLHQADIAFRDHLGDRQPIAAIAHGNLGHQPQMAGDELVRRVAVAMLPPALGQHVFILRFQHREPPDFLEITGQAGFGRQNRQSRSSGHGCALQSLPSCTDCGDFSRRWRRAFGVSSRFGEFMRGFGDTRSA
jgi:hypothetical protein